MSYYLMKTNLNDLENSGWSSTSIKEREAYEVAVVFLKFFCEEDLRILKDKDVLEFDSIIQRTDAFSKFLSIIETGRGVLEFAEEEEEEKLKYTINKNDREDAALIKATMIHLPEQGKEWSTNDERDAVDFFENILSIGMGGKSYVSNPDSDYPQKVIGGKNMSYKQFNQIPEVNEEMKKIYDKAKNRFDNNQEKLISLGVIRSNDKITLSEYGPDALSRSTLQNYNVECFKKIIIKYLPIITNGSTTEQESNLIASSFDSDQYPILKVLKSMQANVDNFGTLFAREGVVIRGTIYNLLMVMNRICSLGFSSQGSSNSEYSKGEKGKKRNKKSNTASTNNTNDIASDPVSKYFTSDSQDLLQLINNDDDIKKAILIPVLNNLKKNPTLDPIRIDIEHITSIKKEKIFKSREKVRVKIVSGHNNLKSSLSRDLRISFSDFCEDNDITNGFTLELNIPAGKFISSEQ